MPLSLFSFHSIFSSTGFPFRPGVLEREFSALTFRKECCLVSFISLITVTTTLSLVQSTVTATISSFPPTTLFLNTFSQPNSLFLFPSVCLVFLSFFRIFVLSVCFLFTLCYFFFSHCVSLDLPRILPSLQQFSSSDSVRVRGKLASLFCFLSFLSTFRLFSLSHLSILFTFVLFVFVRLGN